MARHKINRGRSRRMFKASANSTRAINLSPQIMRGGYRL